MKILSDKISTEKQDVLGRREFASEIAKSLINYSNKNTEGITVSVTGEWGSGKSTLLNFLKKELSNATEKNEVKIIEFNPWIFYNEGNIKEAFLIHFAVELKGGDAKITAVSKKIQTVITAFKFLKNIPVYGQVQEGVQSAVDFFAKNDSIPQMKEEIEAALLKSKKKIFVLIDDIDRLSQSEILELLQTISLIMNFSNVYYIIAFDKDIVINAMQKDYGDRALDYLEKVIQVDYSLPSIRKEKLERLFFQMLSQMEEEYDLKFDRSTVQSLWGYHGLSVYFSTMRDFKRFFNSLSFRLPLIANDVNIHDFIVVEAIRLFDNDGYNRFYSLYLDNLRKRDVPESVFTPEQLKHFSQPTGDIIKAIFPKSTLEAFRTDINRKRLYDSAYFERYFSLLRNEKDISEKEFNEFMQSSETRMGILIDATKNDRIKNLLKRLGDTEISKHFPKYDYSVVAALIDFFNARCEEFEKYHLEVSRAIINLVTAPKKQKEFIKKFFLSFKGHSGCPSIIHVYFFHYIRLFKKENRRFSNDHYQFEEYYKENYDSIYSWFIDAFEKTAYALLVPTYTVRCPFIQYLYLTDFAELFPEAYLTYQKKLLEDRNFLLYVLSRYLWIGKNNTIDRYDFAFKDIIFPGNTFVDFYNSIKNIDKSDLEAEYHALIDNFLKIDISNYPEIRFPE